MQAVILAGGAGTRLRSVVSDRPKSMASVAEKPFLEYQIELLRQHGVSEVVLCVGYLYEHIERYFADKRSGVQVVFSRETTALGTGGALRLAQPHLRESFLLLNGDSFLQLDVRAFAESHAKRRLDNERVVGTLALARVNDSSAYGSVEMDSSGRITRYSEKSANPTPWISAGIYALERTVIDTLPAGQPMSLEKRVLPEAMRSGHELYGYATNGFFVDIGTPEGFNTFRHYIRDSGNGHS